MRSAVQLPLVRLLAVLLGIYAPIPAAAPIPEVLQPWIDWTLRDHPEHRCHRLADDRETRQCLWPGVLHLELTGDGARFQQTWRSQADGQWLVLPGGRDHWPRQVMLDGQPAVVIERDGQPGIWLPRGDHEVRGQWRWEQPPASLALSPLAALVDLRRGDQVLPVVLDAENRLWLRSPEVSAPAADSLQIEVFRRIEDGVPVRLWTELLLTVSGAPREIWIGRVLPEGAVPVDLDSPLPARIQEDGGLRVQLRAGRWRLALESRYLGQPERFAMAAESPHWPQQEIWGFQAAPALRGLRLRGAPAVDPARLDLPPALTDLPVYLVTPDNPLLAEVEYRGDIASAADRLQLQRSLWLDFDGRGATVHDRITGELTRSDRLQARPVLALGRVAVNGEPQVVTRLPGSTGAGVELRARDLQVEAVSRLDAIAGPADLGWERDFAHVGLELYLPPGWRLWHAEGPDQVQGSWLAQWDLWALFLCLLITVVSARLLGWPWGLVAALALALSFHEPGAPVAGWLVVAVMVPLCGALPAGRLRAVGRLSAAAALLLLALAILGFAVQQLRLAIYPQLEARESVAADPSVSLMETGPSAAQEGAIPLGDRSATKSIQVAPPRYRPDENAQTGPGQPSWGWHRLELGWQGPVRADEQLQLWLSPPWLGRSARVTAVVLVTLLWVGWARRWWRTGAPGGRSGAAVSLLLPWLLTIGTAPPAGAAFPPPTLLEELRDELLRPPVCQSHCQGLLEAHLDLTADGQFTLRLRSAAAAALALELPEPEGWQPLRLFRDGAPHPVARVGAASWTVQPPGVENLELHGAVIGNRAAFRFPLTPQALAVSAPGWRTQGLEGGRLRGDTLILEREVATGTDQWRSEPAPAFVRVERHLALDLDWQLTTTVTRIAPSTGAINLEVPLLSGEAVIGDYPRTAAGAMAVTLDATQSQFRWRSLLPPTARLRLVAPETSHWVEVWRVQPSPRWHMVASGPPALAAQQAEWRAWRPWPGESLMLAFQRPLPAPGATVTVENVDLEQRVGARGAEVQVTLVLRSSVGGDYRLVLPVPGVLQRVEIDGRSQSVPERDGAVVLPLRPGLQRAQLTWQLEEGVANWTTTLPLVLPTPATNLHLTLQLPRDRWPVWLRGPDIGPAMLYWGVLAVVVAVALVLGLAVRRLGLSIPLAAWQWLLLGVGMSTVNSAGSLAVIAWFFALEARRRWIPPSRAFVYNAAQLGLIALTLIAVATLIYTIPRSLLAAPDMQVVGNGSGGLLYRWYQDRSDGALPQGAVFSLPLWVYRLAMLAWSLWLVFALVRWARWGWESLGTGGLWRPRTSPAKSVTAAAEVRE